MLRRSIKLLIPKYIKYQKANTSTTTTTTSKWDLLTAICLERKPIISVLPNEIQQKFQKMLFDIELENSHKSDHEIRLEMDAKQAELLKKGDIDLDTELTLKETAQDFEDANIQELQNFKFSDRITNDDKINNLKSLNRKLDKHLVLLVNQKIGDKNYYLLPQGLRQDGEALRQTAERILKDSCPNVKANFYGNAPVGFYKYKYPKEIQNKNGSVGAKVFIYFARYINGELPDKTVEYKWLDRTELHKELPNAYHNSLTQFLIDE